MFVVYKKLILKIGNQLDVDCISESYKLIDL
jgi:hypothetical protein